MEITISIKAEEEEIKAIVDGFGNPKRNVPADIATLRDILATVSNFSAEQVGRIIEEYIKRH